MKALLNVPQNLYHFSFFQCYTQLLVFELEYNPFETESFRQHCRPSETGSRIYIYIYIYIYIEREREREREREDGQYVKQ